MSVVPRAATGRVEPVLTLPKRLRAYFAHDRRRLCVGPLIAERAGLLRVAGYSARAPVAEGARA